MNKGFTLVELLAVIIIIGVIAAIAIPEVSSVIETQRIKAHKIYLKEVSKDVDDFLLKETGQYSNSAIYNYFFTSNGGQSSTGTNGEQIIPLKASDLTIDNGGFDNIYIYLYQDMSYDLYAQDSYGCYTISNNEVVSIDCR